MPSTPKSGSARLAVENLEDRTTPTFLARPGAQEIVVNRATVPTGGLSIAAGDLFPDPGLFGGRVQNEYVTGTGPGTEAQVRVWRLNGQPGAPLLTINPFPGFTGGVNVAVGDVTGDGAMEIIAAVASNGPPHVKVFSASGELLSSFLAFDAGFQGGLNIAVGNVLGGIASGGYSGGTVSSVFKQEIIIGAASGGSPHVLATDAAGTVLRSFLAFDLGFQGGVTVAAGSIDTKQADTYSDLGGADTNAYDEIIVGAASGTPHVKAFEVWTGAITTRLSFYAFDPAIKQGVTVAAGGTDGRRGAEIYVSQVGTAAPQIRAYSGENAELKSTFTPFPPLYTGVVNMAIGFLTPNLSYDPEDDDAYAFFGGNPDFLWQDMVVVSGDGPFEQQPRFYIGLGLGLPAGAYGP